MGDSEEDEAMEIDGANKSTPPSTEHRAPEPENNSGKAENEAETKGKRETPEVTKPHGAQNPCTHPFDKLQSRVRVSPYEKSPGNFPHPILWKN